VLRIDPTTISDWRVEMPEGDFGPERWQDILPAVDRLLRAVPGWAGLPGPMAAMVVRRVVREWREAAMGGVAPPDFEVAVEVVRVEMELLARRRIGVVINGTGVLLHTNLGRAPLAAGVAARVAEVASSYHNLELDMETGERGGEPPPLAPPMAISDVAAFFSGVTAVTPMTSVL
jgi:L-seryl-tRNA(Ser) seleniumtransferase